MKHGHKTPASLHYVRNHGAVPVSWSDSEEKKRVFDEWTVATGKKNLEMKDFLGLPYTTVECLLVCAGNRRKEQNMVKRTIGFNWGPAGLGVGEWGGCYLADVLTELLDVDPSSILQDKHVRFRGPLKELPAGSDGSYGTSLPLRYALDKANDVILAWHHNGELLQADHGYPLRIIIPGFIGGRMVKWLSHIEIAETQSQNHYHFKDNRVLPVNVTPEQADKEGWWFKPDYIINELNINSAISRPAHGEVVDGGRQGDYELRGYAYSGGGRKVIRVEVTLDNGESWHLVPDDQVTHPPQSPTKYGKYWSWCLWKITLPNVADAQTIKVRAWDSSMNTQPHLLTWNVMGMLNNPAFTVLMHKEGDGGRRAEHPTLPGQLPGGWMTPEAKLGQKHVQAPLTVDQEDPLPLPEEEDPFVEETKEELPTSSSTASLDDDDNKKVLSMSLSARVKARKITRAELAKHDSEASCWIEVKGVVFDATPYLEEHPGGGESIVMLAGQDSTEDFEAIHSAKAWKLLEQYAIGVIVEDADEDPAAEAASSGEETNGKAVDATTTTTTTQKKKKKALKPGGKVALKLTEKEELSHNSFRLRFELPSKAHVLGLPVGKHVLIYGRDATNALVARAYTPVTADNTPGYVDFVIKAYRPWLPKFPLGGALSQYLCDRISVGASVDFRGPLGHIEYLGRGSWRVGGGSRIFENITKVGMIAGGTGVTPMVQILINALRDDEDATVFSLILANQTVDDILCKTDLEALLEGGAHKKRFHLHYTVDKKPETEWPYSVGFVGKDVIKTHLPPASEATLVACCGPPGMIDYACKPNLTALGHTEDHQLYF